MSQACAVGQRAQSCQAALERGVDTRGDRFTWTVVDPADESFTEYRSRAEASQQLRLALLALLERPRPVDQQLVGTGGGAVVHNAPIGHLCSFRVEAELTTWPDGPANVTLRIDNLSLDA